MASKSGLLANISKTLGRLILRREMVGTDVHGNYYYSKMEKHEDGMKERRWVKLANSDYDANILPPEWDQWLRKSRQVAPTDEEMARMAQERASVKEKAAILDAEDRKRRFQAESLGIAGAAPAEGPSMDRFVQQLTDQGGAASSPAPEAGASQQQQQQQQQPPSQKVAGEGRYRRSQPPSQQQQQPQPSGSGKDFQPGAWKPPGS